MTKAVPVLGFQQGSSMLFVTAIGSGTTEILRPTLNDIKIDAINIPISQI